MQINDDIHHRMLHIAKCYPKYIFKPGHTFFDSEDESFVRYCNIGRDKKRPGPSLELIFEKHPEFYLYGHYIRFYGLNRRLKRTLLGLKQIMPSPTIYFSLNFESTALDFEDAALVGLDETVVLMLQKRELNFYLTHLSIRCESNSRCHAGFISEIKKYFRPISAIPPLEKKTTKAVSKLFKHKEDIYG